MRIKDLIEKLEVIERDYGNLVLNKGVEDIDLEIGNDTLMITGLPESA